MRFLQIRLACIAALLALAGTADAGILQYNFQLDAPNGYPVTHFVLYAASAGQDDVYLSPIELPPAGVFQLSHEVDFEPTSALVIGITERDQDDNSDIVMFTTAEYAAAALGYRYNEMFPYDNPINLRHNQVGLVLQDAHNGNTAALDLLTSFLRGPDAAAAYFNPHGSFSIIQFSVVAPPIGVAVPEPASLAIWGIGLIGLAVRSRLRSKSGHVIPARLSAGPSSG